MFIIIRHQKSKLKVTETLLTPQAAKLILINITERRKSIQVEDFCRASYLLGTLASDQVSDQKMIEDVFKDSIASIGTWTCFQKAEAMKFYAIYLHSFGTREAEVEKLVNSAKDTLSQLCPHSPKLIHLVMPELTYSLN